MQSKEVWNLPTILGNRGGGGIRNVFKGKQKQSKGIIKTINFHSVE